MFGSDKYKYQNNTREKSKAILAQILHENKLASDMIWSCTTHTTFGSNVFGLSVKENAAENEGYKLKNCRVKLHLD